MSVTAIDVHSHCIPAGYLSAVRGGDPRLEAVIQSDNAGNRLRVANRLDLELLPAYDDVDVRIADMEASSIGVSAISAQPSLYHYWASRPHALAFCRTTNDGLAEMARAHPDRFVGMGTVPLQYPEESVEELVYCVEELGMQSVQIGTHVQGLGLDDPQLLPFFEAADSLRVLVFIHPSQDTWDLKSLLPRYGLRNLIGQPVATGVAAFSLILGGVVQRFPKITFCLAHGGGVVPFIRGRVRHGAVMRDDTPGMDMSDFDDYLSLFYFDSLAHDDASLRFLIDTFGSSRVVIGTDYPVPMGDQTQALRVQALGLDEQAEYRVLRGNAERILKLGLGS